MNVECTVVSVLSHCSSSVFQVSYRDAEALKRQDLLIAEEFEMQQIEESKAKVIAEKEKEKNSSNKLCPIHPSKMLEYYCKQDQEIGKLYPICNFIIII